MYTLLYVQFDRMLAHWILVLANSKCPPTGCVVTNAL